MRTTQFEAAVKSLLNNAIFETDINAKISKFISSGAIDIEGIKEGEYMEVKAAAYVIAKALAEQLRPLSKEGKAEVANLEHFI